MTDATEPSREETVTEIEKKAFLSCPFQKSEQALCAPRQWHVEWRSEGKAWAQGWEVVVGLCLGVFGDLSVSSREHNPGVWHQWNLAEQLCHHPCSQHPLVTASSRALGRTGIKTGELTEKCSPCKLGRFQWQRGNTVINENWTNLYIIWKLVVISPDFIVSTERLWWLWLLLLIKYL